MSKLYMNSTQLLNSIKLRGAVPISQISFTDDDLLNFATEEMNLKIVPSVLAVREEFYVTDESVPLQNNVSEYRIPYRAIGGKVRFVYLQRSDGTLQPLSQLPIEAITEYQSNTFAYQDSGFCLENDKIHILPEVTGIVTGSLVFKYYLKPNKIVAMDRAAVITGIDRTTGDILVEGIPDNITIGSELDFIQSSGNFKILSFDVSPVSVNNASLTINVNPNDISDDLAIGDYVCVAGETVIPQIPSELHVMLAQAVVCRIFEAIGDTQGLQNANAKLQEMELKLLNVIDNRIEAPGRKVVNSNSFLRNRKYSRRYYY